MDEEVDAELRFHVEMRTQFYIERGMTPADARAMAARKFGSIERVTRVCRSIGEGRERRMRITDWLADLRQDIDFALRQFGRARGFTLTALLTLTLGLGASTAIFSVVNGVLLQPLPLTAPDRVVHVYNGVYSGDVGGPTSALNFLDWRAESHSFAQMAATKGVTANLAGGCASRSGGCEPQRLRGVAVSANFFTTLGAHAALGRTFAPGEDEPGARRVAILSHDIWQSRFGGDSTLVGRDIMLNGQPTTVIGVADPGMTLPKAVEIWVPLVFSPADLAPAARGSYNLQVYARLKPGIALADAQRDISAISARLIHEYPSANPELTRPIRIVTLNDDIVGDVATPLLVLFGAVMLVLLIACANVANLLLVRAAGRDTEIAVRTALGAGRGRLVRQLLAESLLLSVTAGVLGALLAWYGVHILTALAPGNIPRLGNVHLDGRVLTFTAAIAILTGAAFGLVPALSATRSDLSRTLRAGVRGSPSGGSRRLRSVFVIAEFAFSLMLLAGAGLLIKSFHRITSVDPGFRPEHVMTFTLDLPVTAYATPGAVRTFVTATTDRLQQIPGVRSAALAYGMDESASGSSFTIDGHAHVSTSAPLTALMPGVTSDFFRAMDIPLIQGRTFTTGDRSGSAPVAILTSSAARRFFPGENPVGHTLRIDGLDDSTAPPRRIVGVVGDTRTLFGPTHQPPPQIYLPLSQNPSSQLIAVIRTAGAPAAIMPAARAAVHEIDPTLPVYHEWTMVERSGTFLQQPRFYMLLLGTFAAVALVLASIGIYGVMSYAVSQRQRELGIRLALGAKPRDVLGLVVAQGASLSAIGLVVGLAAAVGLSRVIASLLFEVTPTDVVTYIIVSLLLIAVALMACIVPARRAARVDPAIALRGE